MLQHESAFSQHAGGSLILLRDVSMMVIAYGLCCNHVTVAVYVYVYVPACWHDAVGRGEAVRKLPAYGTTEICQRQLDPPASWHVQVFTCYALAAAALAAAARITAAAAMQ